MSEPCGMRTRPGVTRWSLRPLLIIAAFMGCIALTPLPAAMAIAGPPGPASGLGTWSLVSPAAGRGAGEEFAVLIVLHLTAAEMNCPYRIEEGRLKRLLNHHGFTLGDVYALSRSETLSAEFEKIVAKYRSDRQQACEIAWKNFGPGAPYEGFLQAR